MKKPILSILAFFVVIANVFTQTECMLDSPSIVCKGERITIYYDSDASFDEVRIDAFTVTNGSPVIALTENKTDTSADIIFLAGGDAEIVVRFINGNTLTSLCNMNVFVLDEEPIPALGMLSNFISNQTTCDAIDLSFEMFIECTDCPFYWTVNDEIIELEQQVIENNVLQIINARLQIEGIGAYTFCHYILKPDSSCFVKDCIEIDIVELDTEPKFSIDNLESEFCKGTTLHFINETIIDEEVIYIWEVAYDSLSWKYSGEKLDFDFLFSGEYLVSLQYYITGDENCVSSVYSESIAITEAPIIPITCSSVSCLDSIFTYQAPIECNTYEWVIDESLGDIISNDASGITVKWNTVDKYTETHIILYVEGCSEDVCGESFRKVSLFPSEILLSGAKGICDKGTEWYETDLIPNANYTWEIEMIDSVSGIAPQITKNEGNRIRVAYSSYIGKLAIRVNATIPSRDCSVSTEIIATSIFILTNDDLCTGELFKASVLPNIDQDVIWTLTNEEIGYFNEQTISGQNQFFAFDLNDGGNYSLNVEVPELNLVCTDEIPLTVLAQPDVILVGPTSICPGESVDYTLEGLGGNDNVVWTIFQNNTSTEIIGNEISVTWVEGGGPYIIKVSRSTEVLTGQVCNSDDFTFQISNIEGISLAVSGPEVVCYDAQGEYEITDMEGAFNWEIDPPYMGTIIEGDSTEAVTIQWHYAPDIPFATLSTRRDICDSLYEAEIDVYFEPYVPVLIAPDSLCSGEAGKILIDGLESYQTIEYYVNDILVKTDALMYDHPFRDTGYVEVVVIIENPNGCPGFSTVSKNVYVIPIVEFSLSASMALQQCPKDSFEDVIIVVDFQDPEGYYIWMIDDVIIKEGFGDVNLYSYIITKELILSGAAFLTLEINTPDTCPGKNSFSLEYDCIDTRCVCIEPVVGMVEYLAPYECNLVSFGGSLDFSTVIDPYWQIVLGDSVVIIPILEEADLTQDFFYFEEGSLFAQVAIRGICEGVNLVNGEIVDSSLCAILIDELTISLYYPDFVKEYSCNEDLTYDIILTERNLLNINPPYSSTVSWLINGIAYEGISILLEDQIGGSTLNIEMVQCSLDGTYCCSNSYETTVRKTFSPNIILPNGSCENDLWLFTLDVSKNEVVSSLWDFGDGSGSTLFLTEKGFLDSLSHDISVVTTDNLGCIATSEITVQSFPNQIDGEIQFESDPCAPLATLNYIENSESIIVNYNWDIINGVDSSTVQVNMSGNYELTVTDNHGCTDVVLAEDVTVNESFPNGMRFDSENCGFANASVSANSEYTYTWFVNGELLTSGNSILLSTSGDYEIKVISTSTLTNEACDSISENLTLYPQPQLPIILEEKLFCDPFIIELSVLNYPSATWSGTAGLEEVGTSIQLAQNGMYSASIEDENGCKVKANKSINEDNISFDILLDQCIQACREDLDSLELSIDGINDFVSNWSWISVDSLGIEYEVQASSGFVTPITITSDMYDYVQLQVVQDECIYQSSRVPLDIVLCTQEEPPVEITCEPIDSEHISCGHSIYKCLISEENGGPKLYFEGSVTLPMDAVLCVEDSLNVSLNNGEIVITELSFEEVDGKLMAYYSANLIISDPLDYQLNGTTIQFDFCNEEGEFAYCYEYSLAYRTCSKDFDCLIDFEGITAGNNQHVDINYCLNLSDVIQEDCTLANYEITAILSGDINIKTIYTTTLNDGFNDLHCIKIPVSSDDFFGGEFQCIELMIEGDCPGIRCSEYQCNIFGTVNSLSQSGGNNAVENQNNVNYQIELNQYELIKPSISIYPNPSTGLFTLEFKGSGNDDLVLIKNTAGQNIRSIKIKSESKLQIDLNDQLPGLYIATWMHEGKIIFSKKILLVD